MSDLTTLRKRRGIAKGSITRISTLVDCLRTADPRDVDVDALQRNLENINKADDSFQVYHQELVELLDSEDSAALQTESDNLTEHYTVVVRLRSIIRSLMAQRKAYLSLDTLDDALVAVEERARDPYDTTLNDELDDLSEQVKELASLCKATGAKDCRTLQDSLQEVRKRVLVLNRARGKMEPKCKSPDAGNTTSPSAPVSSKPKAKLPQLELPSFDGDPLNWCVFWERFNSIIRKETGLSNTDRLAYLRAALKTKDGQVIMDAETGSGDDYDQLVANLKQRFDLKRYVHKNHLCLLMNNEISSYSFKEMLRTQMLWKKHLVGLQKSGQFDSEFLLTSIAELSMDEETQKEWALFTHEHKQVPNFKTFLAFLDQVVGALPSKSSKGRASLQAHKKTSFKAITHIAKGESTCQICEGEAHPAYFRPAFKGLTTDKRFSTAQKLKLCHNCLGTDHLTRTCRSSRTCKRCNKRHHTLLHRE